MTHPLARACLGALTLALALGAATLDAHAFCRTASCEGGDGARCTPAEDDDCGAPLYWPSACVSYAIDQRGSSQVSASEAAALARRAFDAWEGVDCGGGLGPSVAAVDVGPVSCGAAEYSQDKGNVNVIAFRDDAWPYAGGKGTLALTTVTYNIETGAIYDADVELNSEHVEFSTGDEGVKSDLLSILTHELGHFLGLAHSAEGQATMNPSYVVGTIALRDLDEDDAAGICAAYPPDDPRPRPCLLPPRHGFADACAAEQGGCSIGRVGEPEPAAGRAGAGAAWATLAGALGVMLRRRVARARARGSHTPRSGGGGAPR